MNDATTHRSAIVALVANLVFTCLWLTFASGALAAGEYELNDSRETAYGPVAGGVDYTATFETKNDIDWYVFNIAAHSQLDFSSTTVDSTCTSISDSMGIDLYDRDGKSVNRSLSLSKYDEGETKHLRLTMDPGRYYLRAHGDYGCDGSRYRFRIDPPPAITTEPDLGAPRLVVADRRIDVERRRVAVEIECPASAASLACSGKLKLRTRKRVRFSGRRRKAVIGRAVFHVTAGETGAVSVKVGRRRARLLRRKRRARKVWLIVHMRDGSGDYVQRRAKLKLRP